MLDLKKAFDTVDHELLLTKLEKYGIKGNIHSLFKSYLTDRKQYVCVNNCCSDYRTITYGVPQGSILGPTLFSLYVNDIVDDSNFTTRLFADDTVLMLHEKICPSLILKSSLNYIKSNFGSVKINFR